ncbi:MAG TPA: cyclase family protein, partial [Pyrinomonadaceae bacterium]|nr:cyclase family protein [Pyrinomonadaceae bacterium]
SNFLKVFAGEAMKLSRASAATLVFAMLIAGLLSVAHAQRGARRRADAPRAVVLDESKIVDLTYDFDERTVYWPTAKPFELKRDAWGESPGGYFYASASYAASEHGGTHLDSPVHFAEGRDTTERIPLARLVGPALVVDISDRCARNPDYLLTVADLRAWERRHGRIEDGAILLVRTGWGRFWPERKKYLGSDAPGDASNLHFPGISREAAEFLARRRKLDGVGIDTASLDYGQSKDFIAHRVLNGANVYGLENVANLERLPARGATVVALPMKIKGGTGGPVRVIAILP